MVFNIPAASWLSSDIRGGVIGGWNAHQSSSGDSASDGLAVASAVASAAVCWL